MKDTGPLKAEKCQNAFSHSVNGSTLILHITPGCNLTVKLTSQVQQTHIVLSVLVGVRVNKHCQT